MKTTLRLGSSQTEVAMRARRTVAFFRRHLEG